MPWWKSANSPSSSSSSPRSPCSPKRTSRKDLSSIFSRNTGSRLTRQRRLRHGDDDAASSGSTPVSRSPRQLECDAPSRSSSSPPVLQPQPLPLPEGLGTGSPRRLPSPREREEDFSLSSDAVGLSPPPSRFSCQNAHRSPELIEAPSNKYVSRDYKKAIRDPNSVENGNFRLNIPAKSAPASAFSSPALSPRRSSNVDCMPFHNSPPGFQGWSAPEFPLKETLTGSCIQTSPDIILHSSDPFSLHSPARRSPGTRSRNPSAPPSPLHPKLYPDGSSPWHESNGNGNVHPLPLPPGAAVPSQSGFSHSIR
ncbi:mitogen-activated protein kinase kinase kinase 5-like [Iris pallida]|uniref:Mitogen-activated protein kinase kinase kinase 5-like n=1 Tax=Iris pallida TaxID=29817 RepID=A0AAX6I2V7_IRIPA|nr:mitogen-activated protein kinase kinase kinase 5-like [Iris pallida]